MLKNQEYWKSEGTRKTFTHNLFPEWLEGIKRSMPVLDFGCGYGRLTPGLQQLGFADVYGYDSSAPMVKRAAEENPGATYSDRFDSFKTKSFGLVTCFAVFTCCPTDEEQQSIVILINGVTEKDSILYISDYEMADNPHYQERYQQRQTGRLGCFTSGGGIFRHHEAGHFEQLLQGWSPTGERSVQGKTLNGNDITIHQYLFRRD